MTANLRFIKRALLFVSIPIAVTLTTIVHSATYNLPNDFGSGIFASCSLISGSSYKCTSAITIPSGSVINFPNSITMAASGFSVGTNSTLAAAQGQQVTISISNGSSYSLGNGTTSTNINYQSTEDATIGSNVYVVGNLSSSKTIKIGSNSLVVGNVTASSIDFGGGNGAVYGSCTPAYTNCVTPAPVLDWRFDELGWSGQAGEVIDSSTYNRNGVSGGGVNKSHQGIDCLDGAFDGTGYVNGSNVNLGVGGTSKLTVMAWVNWGITPSSGNPSAAILNNNSGAAADTGQFWLQHNASNGAYQFGVKTTAQTFVSSVTAPAKGTWQHVAGVMDGTKLYIYVGGVLESTAAVSGSIAAFNSSFQLNAARWAFSSNNYRGFNGELDEIKVFPAALNPSVIKSIFLNESAGKNWDGSGRVCPSNGLNHVELVHNGSALTCTPDAFTVLACKTSASCYGDPVNQYAGSVTLAPTQISGASWCVDSACTNRVVGSTTLSNGAQIFLFNPNAGSTTVSGSAQNASNPSLLCTNTVTGTTNANSACAVDFATAGFLVNVPDHKSCISQTVTLQAVQASTPGAACVPMFQNKSRDISMYFAYVNPASGTQTIAFNYVKNSSGATSNVSSLSSSSILKTSLNGLYFDDTGTAKLTGFTYPDVGQLTIYPSYAGAVATGDTGLSLTAISGNSFVVAPATLAINDIPSPQAAGSPFPITVSALNACAVPSVTQNFGRESTPSSVQLNSSNPTPSAGNSTPISRTLYGFTSGSASTSLSWNEVGTFDLTASSPNYLGSAVTTTTTKTAVGRFTPGYFETKITPACNTFTYSGQPFLTKVTAKANGSNNTTVNYSGSWAKEVVLGAPTNAPGNLVNGTISAQDFSNGVATANPSFTFTTIQTPPTNIRAHALDLDNIQSIESAEEITIIKAGRLSLLNAYGSELLPLPVSLKAQYFSGVAWATNTEDNCTSVVIPTVGNGIFLGSPASLPSANVQLSISGMAAGTVKLISGEANTLFAAPGRGHQGNLELTISSTQWLKFSWMGQGPVDPTSKVVFGMLKSPLIYARENY